MLPHSGVSLVFTGIAVSMLSKGSDECTEIIQGTIAAAAVINEIIAVIAAKKALNWREKLKSDYNIFLFFLMRRSENLRRGAYFVLQIFPNLSRHIILCPASNPHTVLFDEYLTIFLFSTVYSYIFGYIFFGDTPIFIHHY